MIIKVIYKDKSAGYVNETNLTWLLRKGVVAAFMRSNGWVAVDRDPIRIHKHPYSGFERRRERVRTKAG